DERGAFHELAAGHMLEVDQGFAATYGIPILAGRFFDEARDPSGYVRQDEEGPARKVLLNASAAAGLGYETPQEAIGEFIQWRDLATPYEYHKSFEVIGVLADTQFRSMRSTPLPEIYHFNPLATYFLAVRFEG